MGPVHLTAFDTFRRPPVIVNPLSEDFGSSVRPRIASIASGERLGKTDRSSAAPPETCGVAIDVPLR